MDKVVIVTGASRGIGNEIARTLAKKGEIVIANYNNSFCEAKKLQEELQKENINIDIFKADVTKRNEIKELVNFTIKKYGKIDVLINNAGIAQSKLFTDITDEDWNTMLKANLYSVFAVTQEVVKNMIRNKSGLIINISSIWGLVGASCEVHYSVAKAGLDAMTKSLAKELGLSNIRVNSISPGIIDTKMNENLSQSELNDIIEEIPLQRIGKKAEIAKCVNWLIDDEYTTGQIISINGGWVI